MPEGVYTQSSEAPVVTTSSLDGNPELKAKWENDWDDILSKPVDEQTAPEALEAASPPPVAIGPTESSTDTPHADQPTTTVRTEYGSSKRKLSESTKAPTESEIRDVIDGPKTEVDTPVSEEIDELDALTPHPAASEESSSHFGRLKAKAREIRDELKATKSKIAPIAAELGVSENDLDGIVQKVRQMKTAPGLPTQDAQELEALRVYSNASHLQNSISYLRGFKEPVANAKLQWIERASKFWHNTPEAIQKWANEARQHHEDIDSGWFQQQVQALSQHGKIDAITMQGLLSDADQIVRKEEQGKMELQKLSSDPPSYSKWVQVENEIKGRQIGDQIAKATEKAFATTHKFMEDWKQKSPDDTVFAEREKRFRSTVEGAYTSPEQMAKVALDNIYFKEMYPKLQKELDDEKSKVKEAEKELAALRRRVGVTRRVIDAPLKPSVGHSTNGKPSPTTPRLTSSRNPDWTNLPGGG
ncbi:MAG TPA: hypothetical protein VK775_15830 [Chthoniobacterales bacterium]|jgi:hypothetical protein|nr:hypothetical protein [Chthoniobacterales bacterium]